MFSTEDFIITVFCNVDDLWQEITQGQKIRLRGFAPSLSDSEIITMEIVGEFKGIDTDKGIWNYFRGHWLNLFPKIKSRSSFVRQAANLWCYKEKIQQVLSKKIGGFADSIHLIDGLPIPLCHYQRAKNCRLFAGAAAFGYCATKDEKYYGFKGHLVISSEGVITGFSLTPANGSERDALWETASDITGLLIGDKGYLGADLQRDLLRWGVNLQTAKRSNMKDSRDRNWLKLLVKTRRLIETVIGQLCERFNFETVKARDLWHLTNRINRKLLAHTLAFWINRHSYYPLRFEQLISD